jgi:hypothetical protein
MEVLNNLRAILHKHKENMPVIATAELLAEIDEAEADVCVWKPHGEFGWIIVPPHKNGATRLAEELEIRPYCSVCGRRIKINEADI